MHGLIEPHGGTLVNRVCDEAQAKTLTSEAASLPRIDLTPKQSCDLEMIGIGAFSPLQGFMGQADFESVCKHMKLTSGDIWPIPILLSVDKDAAPGIGSKVALYAPNGTLQAVMQVTEEFVHDKTDAAPFFEPEHDLINETAAIISHHHLFHGRVPKGSHLLVGGREGCFLF